MAGPGEPGEAGGEDRGRMEEAKGMRRERRGHLDDGSALLPAGDSRAIKSADSRDRRPGLEPQLCLQLAVQP